MTELNIHAPFYFKINELLGLNTDEFMNSYHEDAILSDRLEWMERVVSKHETTMEKLTSVAIFSMIEGAVLYSSFAFLKHFNSDGKNKFQNINAGINFSAIDEDIHARTGAWIFNTALHEALNDADEYINLDTLYNDLEVTAWIIAENERDIVRKMFEFGSIEGITPLMLDNFVQSRLDICLTRLGAKTLFEPSYNPIADWFYDDIESSTLHDTFIAMGNDYKRNWTESKFIWKVKND
jgi:ribonucleotide reductase beta subunit family protein with ferritin-like domain